MTAPARPRPSRMIVGAVIGIVAHLAAAALAIVAGRVVHPRPGGFEDLAAVVVTFIVAEVLVLAGCWIGGFVLLRKDRTDLGGGLLVGWAVGAAFAACVIGQR